MWTLWSSTAGAGRAAEAWSRGDTEACLFGVEEAAALWQSGPLPGVGGPLAEAERRKLENRWQATRQLRARALLGSGRTAESLAECTSLAHAYPLDERVALLYCEALYRDGQVGEALSELDAFRRRFRAEMGTQPSDDVSKLYERVLAGDVDIGGNEGPVAGPDGPASATGEARSRAPTVPTQLPHRPWGFVGRAGELAELSHTATLPVLISGHAGVGKSALALKLAHDLAPRFPNGQLYLNLGGSSPEGTVSLAELLDRQLLAFGVHVDDLPSAVEHKAARLRTLLAARRVLLVIDDASDVEQVTQLLPADGNSCAIVTSRRRLSALRGVHRMPLTGLSPETAAQLLVSGCGARLDVDPSDPWVSCLVADCGYVPLAVRVAAVRLADAGAGADTIRTFAIELSGREDPLEVLSLDGDDPSVSVLAGLRRTGETLSKAARNLLSWLSSVADEEFTVETLRGHARDGSFLDVRLPATLDELVEACLLDLPGGAGRYRLPTLVRAYGLRSAWPSGPAGEDAS